MSMYSKIRVALGLSIILVGCRKTNTFDDIPDLRYESYEFIEDNQAGRNSFKLNVFFTDGDGDIGEPEGQPFDTCSADGYNFLIKYFEKVGDTFEEIPPLDSCLPFHNLIPDITPEAQNKTLEGNIISTFPYAGFPQNNTDSIKFEFTLVDRAGNRSAPVESEAIPLPE